MEFTEIQQKNFETISKISSILRIDNKRLRNPEVAIIDPVPSLNYRTFNLKKLFNKKFREDISTIGEYELANGLKGFKILLTDSTRRSFETSSTENFLPDPSSIILKQERLRELKSWVVEIREKYPQLKILVQEGEDSNEPIFYDINNYIACNDFIYAIVEKIESSKIDGKPLSQFEKFLAAQNYVKQFQYNLENKKENESWRLSRTLPGIFASGNICCAGYSNMMLEILDKLKIPSLSVLAGDLNKSKISAAHALISIKLNDDKYNIHGIYFSDVTMATLNEKIPVFVLSTYKQIQNAYKSYNTALKATLQSMSPAEEQAFYFEDDLGRKRKQANIISKYQSYTKSDLDDLATKVINSSFVKKAIAQLYENREVIFNRFVQGLWNSVCLGAIGSTITGKHFKSEKKLADIQQDISLFLDDCLNKTPEQIDALDANPTNAILLAQEEGISFNKLYKQYCREFNRFLPKAACKKKVPAKYSQNTLNQIIDHIGNDLFRPSISMTIKKLSREQDALYGNMLLGQLLVKLSLPVSEDLVQQTSEKIKTTLENGTEKKRA